MDTGTCSGGCVRVRLRRPHQLLVVCTHFGSLLKKPNIKHRLGLILHQADISRVRTMHREISRRLTAT